MADQVDRRALGYMRWRDEMQLEGLSVNTSLPSSSVFFAGYDAALADNAERVREHAIVAERLRVLEERIAPTGCTECEGSGCRNCRLCTAGAALNYLRHRDPDEVFMGAKARDLEDLFRAHIRAKTGLESALAEARATIERVRCEILATFGGSKYGRPDYCVVVGGDVGKHWVDELDKVKP